MTAIKPKLEALVREAADHMRPARSVVLLRELAKASQHTRTAARECEDEDDRIAVECIQEAVILIDKAIVRLKEKSR